MQETRITWDEKTVPANKRALYLDSEFKLKKRKFLVDAELTVGQLMQVVRKHMDILPHEAIFWFYKNRLMRMCETFRDFTSEGIVTLRLEKENTFGHPEKRGQLCWVNKHYYTFPLLFQTQVNCPLIY